MNRANVNKLIDLFKSVRTNVCNEHRTGRPVKASGLTRISELSKAITILR